MTQRKRESKERQAESPICCFTPLIFAPPTADQAKARSLKLHPALSQGGGNSSP